LNNSSITEKTIPNSIRLSLLAGIAGLIADAISLLAVIESIEEYKNETQSNTDSQEDVSEKLQKLQHQINELSKEMHKLKYNQK